MQEEKKDLESLVARLARDEPELSKRIMDAMGLFFKPRDIMSLLRSWRIEIERVRKAEVSYLSLLRKLFVANKLEQVEEQKRLEEARRKQLQVQIPVWQCQVCKRTAVGYIPCPVAPVIIGYETRARDA